IDGCPDCRVLVAELARISSPAVTDPDPTEDVVPTLVHETARGMHDAPPTLVAATDQRSPARDLAPGTVVADRYRLDRLLGEGGTGVVWAATHLLMSRAIALKFLRVPGPDHVRRFLRE